MSLLGQVAPAARLVHVCGIGELGDKAVARLADLLPLANAGDSLTVHVSRVEHVAGLGAALAEGRRVLANIDRVARVTERGTHVEGLDAGIVGVYHYVVAGREEFAGDRATVSLTSPADVMAWIVIDTEPGLDPPGPAARAPMFWLTPVNAKGLALDPETVIDVAATLLLVETLPATPPAFSLPTGTMSAGVGGAYGLAGDVLRHLATVVSARLLTDHLVPDPRVKETSSVPPDIAALVRRYTLDSLAGAVLDPELVPVAVPDPVPGVVRLDGELVTAALDRGRVALSLPSNEDEWPSTLYHTSRMFDLTLAQRWKEQVEASTDHLLRQIEDEVPLALERIASGRAHGPAFVDHVLTQVERGIRTDPRAPQATPDVSGALDALRRALAARPHPVALAFRAALAFGTPALVTAGALLQIYRDARGPLFAALLLPCAAGTGFLFVQRRIRSTSRAAIACRDAAVDSVIRRQEVLLASQIAEGLRRLRTGLAAMVSRGRTHLQAYVEAVTTARDEAAQAVAAVPTGTAVLKPVIRELRQYEQIADAIQDGLPDLLSACAATGALRVDDGGPARVREKVMAVCAQSLLGRRSALGRYARVWGEGGDTRNMEERLRDTAVPLAAVDAASRESVVVLPPAAVWSEEAQETTVEVEGELLLVVTAGRVRGVRP